MCNCPACTDSDSFSCKDDKKEMCGHGMAPNNSVSRFSGETDTNTQPLKGITTISRYSKMCVACDATLSKRGVFAGKAGGLCVTRHSTLAAARNNTVMPNDLCHCVNVKRNGSVSSRWVMYFPIANRPIKKNAISQCRLIATEL